jgi:hypothetical protein
MSEKFEVWDGEAEFVIQEQDQIDEATAYCEERYGSMPSDTWMKTTPSWFGSPSRRPVVATALFVIYDETAAFEFRMRWS